MTDPGELVHVELTDEERRVLRFGIVEWGGPPSCTDAMAVAMGFTSVGNLFEVTDSLLAALDTHQPMSRRDWTRLLLATEIVFASDVIGSGLEWPDTTGLDDAHTLQVLRGIQLKMATVRVRIGPRPRR